MTSPSIQNEITALPRHLSPKLRGTGAILASLVCVAGLSHATDAAVHAVGYFPLEGAAMTDTMYAVALAYRTLYGMLGGFIAARLAPARPQLHANWLGGIGTVLSALGIVAALGGVPGPLWYPIGLALSAFPSAWIGGRAARRG
jgi:hypothetical protein